MKPPVQTTIFLVAGEMSGDKLGASVMTALKQKMPDLSFQGIGGPYMREAGVVCDTWMEELQVMGFIDVALHLPSLIKIFKKTVKTVMQMNPDIVITLDYPGFNLRLAKALRQRGFQGKLCHIVCPSVWAWGKKRIATLAQNYDLLLTLLPFEKKLFHASYLPVTYIGHPLTQEISLLTSFSPHILAFFPGSRRSEIKRNFPFYIKLIHHLKSSRPDLQFAISISQEKYRPYIEDLLGDLIQDPCIQLLTPSEMQHVQPLFAIAKCGTIVLELALKGIPTVVTYKMSQIDLLLAKYLFRIHLPYYSLPNLILNTPLFPELIGNQLTEADLLQTTLFWLDHQDVLSPLRSACLQLREQLTLDEHPSERAALEILHLIF
ncbi:MAG: lipid-A-disaccharide synthase [Candidatus Rhabdochlamydia sp.]